MVTVASLALALALGAPGTIPSPPDSVVARAREALRTLADSAALHAAGYFPIGFGAGTRDLTPFQGQHWIDLGRFLTNPPVLLSRPNFAIYLPVGDSLIPVGVAYSRRIPADSAQPTEIAGTPAGWHAHAFCRGIPGEGNVLADGPDDCRARGGTPAPNQITMVHAWTVQNPDGAYGHDNPALPFLATRLRPPTTRRATTGCSPSRSASRTGRSSRSRTASSARRRRAATLGGSRRCAGRPWTRGARWPSGTGRSRRRRSCGRGSTWSS